MGLARRRTRHEQGTCPLVPFRHRAAVLDPPAPLTGGGPALPLPPALQFCVDCRFDRNTLEQVRGIPGASDVRGLRGCGGCGVVFSRDKMAGTTALPRVCWTMGAHGR